MRKHIALALGLILAFVLAGCSSQEIEADDFPQESELVTWDTRPIITLYGRSYIAPYMPVDELPEGYEYIGDVPEGAANDAALEGCRIYAVKGESSVTDFYLYQECGTPISKDTVDATQRQWAYVRWVLPE